MADVSRIVLPNQSGYDLKDKNAARTMAFEPHQSISHEFYVELKNAAGTVIDTRHLYLWVDGNNLQLGDLTDGNTILAQIPLYITSEFEQNQVTPNEFWFKIKVDGAETDNHWMLAYLDNNDLCIKDLSAGAIEVVRIPFLATYIDFEAESGAPNNFFLNLRNNQGTILSQTHCFINNRGGTFVFGYEDRDGVWHDIASC